MNVVIDNDVWCELEVKDCVCKYKFLLLNIPSIVGGYKKARSYLDDYWKHDWRNPPPKVIDGMIFCDSNESVQQCASAIEMLIRNGYEEQHISWLIGMDMGDLFMHLNGEPMKFLHKTFSNSFDKEELKQIQGKIKDSRFVCCYILLPNKDFYDEQLNEIDIVHEKFFSAIDAEILFQCSLQVHGDRTINVWYK